MRVGITRFEPKIKGFRGSYPIQITNPIEASLSADFIVLFLCLKTNNSPFRLVFQTAREWRLLLLMMRGCYGEEAAFNLMFHWSHGDSLLFLPLSLWPFVLWFKFTSVDDHLSESSKICRLTTIQGSCEPVCLCSQSDACFCFNPQNMSLLPLCLTNSTGLVFALIRYQCAVLPFR